MPLSYKHALIIRAFYQALIAKKDPNDWYKKNVIDQLTFADVKDIDITPEAELPELTVLPKNRLITVGKHKISGKTAISLSGLKRQTLLPVMGTIAKIFIANGENRATLAKKFTADEIVEGLRQYIEGLNPEDLRREKFNVTKTARNLVDTLGYTREEIIKALLKLLAGSKFFQPNNQEIAMLVLEQLYCMPQNPNNAWSDIVEDPATMDALNLIMAGDSYSLTDKSKLTQLLSIAKNYAVYSARMNGINIFIDRPELEFNITLNFTEILNKGDQLEATIDKNIRDELELLFSLGFSVLDGATTYTINGVKFKMNFPGFMLVMRASAKHAGEFRFDIVSTNAKDILGQGSSGFATKVKGKIKFNEDGKVYEIEPQSPTKAGKIVKVFTDASEYKGAPEELEFLRLGGVQGREGMKAGLAGNYIQQLVMYQKAGDMDLASFLKKQKTPLSTVATLSVFGSLIQQLASVNQKITHQDLKPGNIVIRQSYKGDKCNIFEIWLIDFGLAKNFKKQQEQEEYIPLVGTTMYTAPELILSCNEIFQTVPSRLITPKIDAFSLGCTLLEMIWPKQADAFLNLRYLVGSALTSGRLLSPKLRKELNATGVSTAEKQEKFMKELIFEGRFKKSFKKPADMPQDVYLKLIKLIGDLTNPEQSKRITAEGALPRIQTIQKEYATAQLETWIKTLEQYKSTFEKYRNGLNTQIGDKLAAQKILAIEGLIKLFGENILKLQKYQNQPWESIMEACQASKEAIQIAAQKAQPTVAPPRSAIRAFLYNAAQTRPALDFFVPKTRGATLVAGLLEKISKVDAMFLESPDQAEKLKKITEKSETEAKAQGQMVEGEKKEEVAPKA